MPPDTDIIDVEGNAIDKVNAALAQLCRDGATQDDALNALAFRDRLKEVSRDLCEQIEQNVIEFIQLNGDLECGDIRWYVAPNKSTKCHDQRKALEELLTACGGDLDQFAECLASNALKHGACKNVMAADVYGRLFFTTQVLDLKEGKPKNRLQKLDARFTKQPHSPITEQPQ